MDNRGLPGLRRVGTILLIGLAAALAWVAATILWLWRNQERVVFQPPPVVAGRIEPARRVEFLADDGQPLFGFLIDPPAGGAGPVVIAFHGNADLAALLIPWGAELSRRSGATVLLPEYRGYGGIEGRPTYVTASADARGALSYARQAMPERRIVLFGHSLGSAVAAELAAGKRPPVCSALVLESPFTSAMDMAARMLVPPVPGLWGRISRVHYDTRARVSALDAPVWVAHGSADMVIPVRMGRAVFAAAHRQGELLIVPGAGHNDVADLGGSAYWEWLTRAVSARLGELQEQGRGRLP